MEIKTKYNIGDKVWAMYDNEPSEFIIYSIQAFFYEDLPYSIWYINNDDEGYQEDVLFPTKEELLKHYNYGK